MKKYSINTSSDLCDGTCNNCPDSTCCYHSESATPQYRCCPNNLNCVAGGVCCAPEKTYIDGEGKKQCCPTGEVVINNECAIATSCLSCSQGFACGDQCVDSNTVCCNGKACDSGHSNCCNGKCCSGQCGTKGQGSCY